MGERDESCEGKGGVSVGGGRTDGCPLGFGEVVPVRLGGDGERSGACVCRGCVLVFWCCVVGGGVCLSHGLTHGVEEEFPSSGAEVIGESE